MVFGSAAEAVWATMVDKIAMITATARFIRKTSNAERSTSNSESIGGRAPNDPEFEVEP
jgi:hypothetical protein